MFALLVIVNVEHRAVSVRYVSFLLHPCSYFTTFRRRS